MQGMDWDNLRYVLTIARAGTLAGAARRLGVNQTTTARRLIAAERDLGARLFDRIDGALIPTKAGEIAVARAVEVEHEVEAIEHGIGGGNAEIAGLVRLTSVPVLVNRLLIPALPRLLAIHPGLRLELIAEPRNLNLARRETDIALRLSRPDRVGGVVVRRAGQLDYAIYGPHGSSADELRWISYEEGLGHLPQARWIAAAVRSDELAPFRVSDAEALIAAIRAGLGKSLLPCFAGERDDRLQRFGGPEPVLSREVWQLTHKELRRHTRISAATAWLSAVLRES
jgi:DNA-binding transcriptional LysR family regulator